MRPTVKSLKPFLRVRVAALAVVIAGVVFAIVSLSRGHAGSAGSPARVQHAIEVALHHDKARAAGRAVTERAGDGSHGHERAGFAGPPGGELHSYRIGLSGSAPIPRGYPPLAAGSSARVTLRLAPVADRSSGRLCWRLSAERGEGVITGGEIHEGAHGQAGGQWAVLSASSSGEFHSAGCMRISSTVLIDIVRDPAGFYVQLDSRRHPFGALRGQL